MDDLCKSVTQLHYQVKKLTEIHNNLKLFNHTFASFLLGIQMQADCIIMDEIVCTGPIQQEGEDEAKDTKSTSHEQSSQSSELAPAISMHTSQDEHSIQEGKSVPGNVAASTRTMQSSSMTKGTKQQNTLEQISLNRQSTQQQKSKSVVSAMKKVAANIPLAMRDAHQLGEIELLVKILVDRPQGEYVI